MTSNEPPRPPDRPVVPRPRFAKTAIFFAVLGTLIVGSYSAMAFTGFEPGTPERDEIPQTERAKGRHGYRSFHFWHSGYHGGK